MKPILKLIPLLLYATTICAGAAERTVSSAADIARLSNELQPGDVLLMADGNWQDQAIVFRARGTAEKPITLRAKTPGHVILTGQSSLIIDGEHVVVSGLFLKNGQATNDGVKLAGRHCRLTESAIVGGNYKFFIHLFGAENRIDHCYLADKTNDSPTLQVEVEGRPNHHRIDFNHFGPRPPLGRNGGETMRIGYSHQSMTNSGTLVERNLFDRCDGEIEIISSKSCENIYRYNTFLNCAGMLTLRHGNRCLVEGNFFLGQNKRGSGGVRIIGDDHIIINNYIENVAQGGFWITAGIVDSPLNGYFQARNCVVAFNTFLDSPGPCLDLDAGFGTSRRTLHPENITIANNIFAPTNGKLSKGAEAENYHWIGNLLSSQGGEPIAHKGIRAVDLKFGRDKTGILRPTSVASMRGAAEGNFPAVKTDVDGQERRPPFDIGCDQISAAPAMNRPLRAADVGPAWMTRDDSFGSGAAKVGSGATIN